MPVRLLKPGLRTSEKFNRCSFIAQSAYIRLLMMVDDAGRYLANPRLLRSELFPLGDSRGADISVPKVETVLAELQANKLILLYESESKSHLQLTNWNERVRTQSKFPAPADCEQPQTVASKCSQMIASPPSPSPSPSPSPLVSADEPRQRNLPDAEWLASLKSNPAYEGIDVDREFGKMTVWCEANGKRASRRRFVNWLNRVEKPMVAPSAAKPLSVYELKAIIEAKQKVATEFYNRHSSPDATGATWDSQDNRKKFVAMKTEIKTLESQLAGKA